jgi:predicted metal-dependent HD superfamily phosphohydrolase
VTIIGLHDIWLFLMSYIDEDIVQEVKSIWNMLCDTLAIEITTAEELWSIIHANYSEAHRYYHTLHHIHDLLQVNCLIAFQLYYNLCDASALSNA